MRKIKYKAGKNGIEQFWIGNRELECQDVNFFRTERKVLEGVHVADVPLGVTIEIQSSAGSATDYSITRIGDGSDVAVEVTINVSAYAKFWDGPIGLGHYWKILESVSKKLAPTFPGETEILNAESTDDGHYDFLLARRFDAVTTDDVLRIADATMKRIEGVIAGVEKKVSGLIAAELASMKP